MNKNRLGAHPSNQNLLNRQSHRKKVIISISEALSDEKYKFRKSHLRRILSLVVFMQQLNVPLDDLFRVLVRSVFASGIKVDVAREWAAYMRPNGTKLTQVELEAYRSRAGERWPVLVGSKSKDVCAFRRILKS